MTPEEREAAKAKRRQRYELRLQKEELRRKQVKKENEEYYQNSTAWHSPRERK